MNESERCLRLSDSMRQRSAGVRALAAVLVEMESAEATVGNADSLSVQGARTDSAEAGAAEFDLRYRFSFFSFK